MVPARRAMPAMTSALVAICGTHFGDTNDAASMLAKPALVRRSTSSIFTSAGTLSFSFCRPSRGPTSTILTCFGKLVFISISPVAVDHAVDHFARLDLADFFADLLHAFAPQRQRRDVRRDRDARLLPERMLRRQGLVAEHVERGGGDVAGLDQREQVRLGDVGTARHVDDVSTG